MLKLIAPKDCLLGREIHGFFSYLIEEILSLFSDLIDLVFMPFEKIDRLRVRLRGVASYDRGLAYSKIVTLLVEKLSLYNAGF